MGISAALVFASMIYLGNFVCLPVENDSCVSLLPTAGTKVTAATESTIPSIPSISNDVSNPPTDTNSSIPKGTGGIVTANGNKVSFDLSFQMSPDFSKYGFNAPIGSTGANPDISVHSGDTVTIHITNPSKSFHAFGIVTDPQDPSSIVWNASYKTPDSPMKPKESGDVTFVAGTPGLYHYICTVPGHATLGMDGNFIVEK
ncbi:MAG TPA: cupredoxin domain-containing protein [Candidatus Nitrosotalea sp.]|nr:cupredoxin domain-containing protein [Candidatus Nitrosotalea sp.]